MRVIYIAGKYRHYNADGTLDYPRMAAEVEAEKHWSARLWEWGHMPIAPMCNSIHMEGHPGIDPDHYIAGDVALLDRLAIGYDAILMRPGWESSVGANAERDAARERGLVVLYGEHGEDVVRQALEVDA